MIGSKRPNQKFPSSSWAWPTAGLHLLLTAAISPDDDVALAAARQWLTTHDIDDAEFRESRLLLAIIDRFGKSLSDLDSYPRLIGLQRMLWTKSRMALREALPAIKTMSEQGIPVMMIKGAARIAVNPNAQKARVSHDTDILVPRANAHAALDILSNKGWTPSTGESLTSLSARLHTTRSVNMFFGHFGDVDLHFSAADTNVPHPEFDRDIWQRAENAAFFDVAVLVPSTEDWLAISIASSALDAHAHSDWLVDCASTMTRSPLDSERILKLFADLDLLEQSAISFGYLSHKLGVDVPFLSELEKLAAKRSMLAKLAIRLECKPRGDWNGLSKLARGLCKQVRMAKKRKAFAKPSAPIRGRCRKPTKNTDLGSASGHSHLLHEKGSPKGYLSDLIVEFVATGERRRYDFELNTDRQHIARLRLRSLRKHKNRVQAIFKTDLDLSSIDGNIWIESRPNRNLRSVDTENEAKHCAVPFSVTKTRISFKARTN